MTFNIPNSNGSTFRSNVNSALNTLQGEIGSGGNSIVNLVSPNELIPVMTSNTTPSGTMSASSTYAGTGYEYHGVDGSGLLGGSPIQGWITPNGVFSGWYQYDFEVSTAINKYTLQPRNFYNSSDDNGIMEFPGVITLQASNTGLFQGEEITLDSQTGQTMETQTTLKEYTFVNSTSYLHYRLNVSDCPSIYHIGFGMLQFYNTAVGNTYPVSPSQGQLVFDTMTNQLLIYVGTSYIVIQ